MSSTWREDKFYYLCSRQIAKLIIQSIKLLFILPIVRDDMVQNSIKILIFVGGVEPPHYVLIFCILLEYIIHYLYHHILKFSSSPTVLELNTVTSSPLGLTGNKSFFILSSLLAINIFAQSRIFLVER